MGRRFDRDVSPCSIQQWDLGAEARGALGSCERCALDVYRVRRTKCQQQEQQGGGDDDDTAACVQGMLKDP